MTPYIQQFVAENELRTFEEVRLIVNRLPNIDLSDIGEDEHGDTLIISCHMLARAISTFFSLKVRDGKFMSGYQHSWLETASGHIIDVYPVATLGGPILIDGGRKSFSPSRGMYTVTHKKYYGHKFDTRQFRRCVKRL